MFVVYFNVNIFWIRFASHFRNIIV